MLAEIPRGPVRAEYGPNTDAQIWVTEAGARFEVNGKTTNLYRCGGETGVVARFLWLAQHPQVVKVFWHGWVGHPELDEAFDSGVIVGLRNPGEWVPWLYLPRPSYCTLNGQSPSGFGQCA